MLMSIFIIGNLLLVVVFDYMMLLFVWFVISFNYGVFFGLGFVVVVSFVLCEK